ncbi:hypothetical protein EGR_04627 [Echinococcus granulosus]|uniref:Uncharacterized protein n=1 Tax=Echinococcus granulosus TaxID=6210 RepID=W6UHA3_ECHGR|nr:hypothetical protein EGR_04627 [Echinococcus granulosus]EUB60433.1 hypothetical protein EGR_04627 [Echinococcus granulosus]
METAACLGVKADNTTPIESSSLTIPNWAIVLEEDIRSEVELSFSYRHIFSKVEEVESCFWQMVENALPEVEMWERCFCDVCP